MPINRKLMRNLQEQYGKEKGTSVYYAMERQGHPSTKVTTVREHNRDGTYGVRRHRRRLG